MRIINALLTWSTTGTSTYTASGDISNAALYSQPFSLRHMDHYAIQLVTTGTTVTGAFKLQASVSDPTIDNSVGYPVGSSMDWTDIDGSSTTVAAAGSVVWNAQGVGYPWVRVVWTESGTASGAVTGRVHGKGTA